MPTWSSRSAATMAAKSPARSMPCARTGASAATARGDTIWSPASPASPRSWASSTTIPTRGRDRPQTTASSSAQADDPVLRSGPARRRLGPIHPDVSTGLPACAGNDAGKLLDPGVLERLLRLWRRQVGEERLGGIPRCRASELSRGVARIILQVRGQGADQLHAGGLTLLDLRDGAEA